MPRESHLVRQVQWKNKLSEYGCRVNLEKTVYIGNAPIIVDVYAEVEGKKFLIEIGDISDKRKVELMKLYAKQNSNIEFVHEPYDTDKIGKVLENLTAYRNSDEYHQLRIAKEKAENQKYAVYLGLFLIFFVGFVYFHENFPYLFGWILLWFTGLITWKTAHAY